MIRNGIHNIIFKQKEKAKKKFKLKSKKKKIVIENLKRKKIVIEQAHLGTP